MAYQLSFEQHHKYASLESGITITAILRRGDIEITCDAKVDTGAQVCLFSREIGEELGINVENGAPIRLGTVAGIITAYGHEVILETLGLRFHTFVYFAEVDKLSRNLLGRTGWLQLIRLAIIDYDQEFYLSNYDETD